jgi:RNA polymerase sigma factor (sigma-70 family)
MSEADDAQLLRDYAGHGSETAFAELVQRNIGLVYSAAFRHVGVAAQAEEITQAVFIILARKAASVRSDLVLQSWLYATTRLTALSFLRGERRRQLREQEAYMQSALQETGSESLWPQLAPLLDEAISHLGRKDRDALVLRFFKEKEVREVAAALRVSEAATHKRVNRALEKLRLFFAKRGISSTTAVIAREISAHSIQAPPAGLAAAVTAAAVAKGATASASTLTLIKGALNLMAWTKAKTAALVGASVLALGTSTVVVSQMLPLPEIQGTWEGTATIPAPGYGVRAGESPRTRLVLRIAKTNDTYLADVEDIDQGDRAGTRAVIYKYPAFRMDNLASGTSYRATVSRGGGRISGTFVQRGHAVPVVFKRTNRPPPFPEPLADEEISPRPGSDLQGLWAGVIRLGNRGLPVKIKIAESYNKAFRADFYSTDQTTNRVPMSVSYDGDVVKLMPMAGWGMFKGRLRNGRKELSGTWTQNGRKMLMTLARAN